MTADDSSIARQGAALHVSKGPGTADKLSVSVHFVREVLRHALENGVDPLLLLRRLRIPPRLLREPQARIGIQQFADLQTLTMQAMGDESLGYAQRRVPLGAWNMMCQAVITASTLGQALARYCRFFQLFDDGIPVALEQDSQLASVILDPQVTSRGSYFAELVLLNTHRFACWLVQEELPLREVRFAGQASASPADYRLMFLANPVKFEAQENALVMAASLLEKPVRQTPETLARYLRHPTLVMLTTLYRDSWTARVREKLRQDLRHMPELPDVAEKLELHPQTLRRRLATEGTTFKQLKSDIRRDTALHFLAKRALSVEEVAHRAGFSEASAFIRAFKGWTGLTPYAYRKGL